jgi:uncharacterized protein YceH (UPF0502 family)
MAEGLEAADVDRILERLATRPDPLVVCLGKAEARRAERYAHTIYLEGESLAVTSSPSSSNTPAPALTPAAAPAPPAPVSPSPPAPAPSPSALAALEARVVALEARVSALERTSPPSAP